MSCVGSCHRLSAFDKPISAIQLSDEYSVLSFIALCNEEVNPNLVMLITNLPTFSG